MVCLSWADDSGRGLLNRPNGLAWIREKLLDDDVILVGHNGVFDYGIICAEDPSLVKLVFDKHEKGLVHDTQTRAQMLDIARGWFEYHPGRDGKRTKSTYSLAALALRYLDRVLPKQDTWRLKYALLDGVDVVKWPEEAIRYALDDASTTLDVWRALEKILNGHELPTSAHQHKAQWALHLISMWGLRTDGERIAKVKAALEKEREETMSKLRTTDVIRGINKKTGKDTKNMAAIRARVEKAYTEQGRVVPLTDGGQTATDKETLEESGDEVLKWLASISNTEKLLGTYIPMLEKGTNHPINPRFHVVMETARTSSSDPSCQTVPRKGGIRECFVPPEGHVLVHVDFDTLELRALAQVLLDFFGQSTMAEALRAGEDLHLRVAAQILNIDPREAVERYNAGDKDVEDKRQIAKALNFGAMGGLGAATFVEYAKAMGVKNLDVGDAKRLLHVWKQSWPEMQAYFARISAMTDGGDATIVHPRSGFVRGGVNYCAACNSHVQELAAQGAKAALWNVQRECYLDKNSPLYGVRPIVYIHDEIGAVVKFDASNLKPASDAADRMAQVMREGMAQWIPDIPIGAGPVMMRRWYKGAKAVRVDGLLVPSKPEERTDEKTGKKKTVWVADL